MPAKLAIKVLLSIFKRKCDMNCSWHEIVKLLEHGIKVVEKAFENGFID